MRYTIAAALTVLGAAAGVLAPRIVSAHHSFSAEFDAARPFTLTGVVTKVEWMNPHTFFYIDVVDGTTGAVVNWAMEMGSPNALQRAGWTRNSMNVGDRVTVEGSLAKDGSRTGNARSVTLESNGRRLFAASSQGQWGARDGPGGRIAARSPGFRDRGFAARKSTLQASSGISCPCRQSLDVSSEIHVRHHVGGSVQGAP